MIVGMRFHPTDEEIIGYYLRNKMMGNDHLVDHVIGQIDVYQMEPSQLPGYSRRQSDDQVWYFFCHLDLSSSGRVNRRTTGGIGFWKATGKVRKVRSKQTNEEMGTKRSLVYYSKTPSSETRTNWVIHEYQANLADQLVVCKLKNKGEVWIDNLVGEEGESSQAMNVDDSNVGGEGEAESLMPIDQPTPDDHSRNEFEDKEAIAFADACLNDGENEEDRFITSTGTSHGQLQTLQTLPLPSIVSAPVKNDSDTLMESSGVGSSVATPRINRLVRNSAPIPQFYSTEAVSSAIFRAMNTAPLDTSNMQAEELGSSIDVTEKERLGRVTRKEVKMLQVLHLGPDVKARSKSSSGNETTSHFVQLHTSPSSNASSPPSVFVVNALVGLLLLIMVVREIILYH